MSIGFGRMRQDIIGGDVHVVVILAYTMGLDLRKLLNHSPIGFVDFANGSRISLRIEVNGW